MCKTSWPRNVALNMRIKLEEPLFLMTVLFRFYAKLSDETLCCWFISFSFFFAKLLNNYFISCLAAFFYLFSYVETWVYINLSANEEKLDTCGEAANRDGATQEDAEESERVHGDAETASVLPYHTVKGRECTRHYL